MGGGAALLFAGADIHFSAELINSIKIDGSVVLAALRCTSAILLYGHEVLIYSTGCVRAQKNAFAWYRCIRTHRENKCKSNLLPGNAQTRPRTHHERDKGAGPPLQFPFTNMARNMCVTYIHLGS